MTTIQKFGYASLASVFGVLQTFAAGDTFFGKSKATNLQGGTAATGEQAVINVIRSALQFVTLIAVIYCLWAGFQIMTAGGDEEKVKHGRKTIIQVVIGIVVMWLAYAIVTWIIGALS